MAWYLLIFTYMYWETNGQECPFFQLQFNRIVKYVSVIFSQSTSCSLFVNIMKATSLLSFNSPIAGDTFAEIQKISAYIVILAGVTAAYPGHLSLSCSSLHHIASCSCPKAQTSLVHGETWLGVSGYQHGLLYAHKCISSPNTSYLVCFSDLFHVFFWLREVMLLAGY